MQTFTEQELRKIYETYVKLPTRYFEKYKDLPMCPIKSWNYKWQNFDFPRNWCILDFREWIDTYSLSNIQHLGYTCESDPELEFLNPTTKTYLKYPPYDLHTIQTHFQNTFDFFYLIKLLSIYITHLWLYLVFFKLLNQVVIYLQVFQL